MNSLQLLMRHNYYFSMISSYSLASSKLLIRKLNNRNYLNEDGMKKKANCYSKSPNQLWYKFGWGVCSFWCRWKIITSKVFSTIFPSCTTRLCSCHNILGLTQSTFLAILSIFYSGEFLTPISRNFPFLMLTESLYELMISLEIVTDMRILISIQKVILVSTQWKKKLGSVWTNIFQRWKDRKEKLNKS